MVIEGEIGRPIAWTRETLAAGNGRVRLSPECVTELLGAVSLLRANPLPVLALDPTDFDLAQCRRVMAGIRDRLEHGPGFAIVDRLPLEHIERTEAIALFWLLSSLIARPVAQKWDGTMVYDVRDTG